LENQFSSKSLNIYSNNCNFTSSIFRTFYFSIILSVKISTWLKQVATEHYAGVHQKVWGNHAATLISSGSFTDFIIQNFGYFFLNSPSQSLFNTLVWLSFLKEFYFFKLVKKSLDPHFLMHSFKNWQINHFLFFG
jgi:hypothetical protein